MDALGVHTLLGMPAPWVHKLGFARRRPRRAPGNPPGPEGVGQARLCHVLGLGPGPGPGPSTGCRQLPVGA